MEQKPFSIRDSLMYNGGAGKYNTTHSDATAQNQNRSAAVTPNDGTADGTTLTSNGLVIQNVVSNVTGISITPIGNTTAYANVILNGTAYYSDFDGDSATVYFRWLVDGEQTMNHTFSSVVNMTNLSATLGIGNYSRDDAVFLSVVANDGYENNTIQNSSVTIIQDLAPAPLLS